MKRFKAGSGHFNIFACDPGKLIPVSCYEGLPGETIQQSSQALIRVLPQNTPVMHPVQVRVHTWQVPLRVIWPEFEQFITGGPDGNDATIPPRISAATVEKDSPADYLGIKPGANRDISELPFRAVAACYNEKYRDQDLMAEIDAEGTNWGIKALETPFIAWEKTRETAARPWPQKGPDVTLPLGEKADIAVDGATTESPAKNIGLKYSDGWGSMQSSAANVQNSGNASDPAFQMFADLSTATSPNINDWRTAFAVQRWQEARAQYGSRFTEYLRYCGVISSDQRLQLPEYLGGGKQVVSFSEVLSTNENGAGPEQAGVLRGHGISAIRTRPFRRFIEEHSYILTFLSIRPKLMWMAGQHRMWDRVDKMDWFQKELQYIGQEEIYNREVSVDHSVPGGVLGYNNRYGSFLKIPSRVSGEMRDTLNTWHMARDIVGDFALNEDFVKCDPTDRVYAQSATPNYVVMFNNSVRRRTPVDPRPYNRII